MSAFGDGYQSIKRRVEVEKGLGTVLEKRIALGKRVLSGAIELSVELEALGLNRIEAASRALGYFSRVIELSTEGSVTHQELLEELKQRDELLSARIENGRKTIAGAKEIKEHFRNLGKDPVDAGLLALRFVDMVDCDISVDGEGPH